PSFPTRRSSGLHFRLFALAFACQLGFGIRFGFVRLVATLFPAKVYRVPAYVARRWRIVVALGPETFDRRPRLNQRAVHREMLIADQVLFARELDDAAEKQIGRAHV